MDLNGLLKRKREAILKRWIQSAISDYPPETQRFLQQKKDQFENPVGYALRTGLASLFDEIMEWANPESVSSILDPIIRIRAVQDLTAAQAVGFVMALKEILREELGGGVTQEELGAFLHTVDRRCDEVALKAFDIYSACREEIHNIRVKEWKRRSFEVLERINRYYERGGQGLDIQDGGSDDLT